MVNRVLLVNQVNQECADMDHLDQKVHQDYRDHLEMMDYLEVDLINK